MVFLSLQYLSGAVWCAGIRRIPEALMSVLPIAAVLMLGLFFGRGWDLPRRGPGAAALPAAKALYLGAPFFFGRMALFVVVWSVFALLMRRTSVRQDDDPAPRHHAGAWCATAAAFAVVFAISFSLASFDWIMTLDPQWTSTIFAVYLFAACWRRGSRRSR